MTGQGVLFRLGAELLEQPALPFTEAAAAPAAAAAVPAAVSCGYCGLVHSAYAGTPLIETCPKYQPPAPLVIVGCGAGKLDRPARARDLYTGQQYRACMATAEALTEPGRIRILSAAHGLVELDTETAPYDVKMGAVGSVTVHQLRQQAERAGLLEGEVIILAGADYTALCRGVWPDAQTPLAGLGIGRQRAELAAMRRAAAAADPQRITRQRELVGARQDEARDHRRFCVRCVDGRQCRDGRKADKEARLSRDVLRAMLDGTL